ncbi:LPS-assembly protein [Ectothiorhodosinus mongolicus]|uniref:LPS-assembly protein LptD n=2 Tax=Ectothiorhodosinus mongolicus TaxID=233100 RepID=A0A1R3W0F4_9GAMM|nr:organic solvent tolerance protein [Ectothiorhodosinus mongolicus]SIT71070.1 LPS-assembly protein [Ectothiorhodosinus mongolicus]
MDRGGISELIGNAEAHQDARSIYADRIEYDEAQGRVDAFGNVQLDVASELSITGPEGFIFLETLQGEFREAEYFLYPRHARGEADLIEPRGENRTRLTRASYTTCDPGRNDWLLRASRVDLNQETGRGVARNAWLSFYRVPLLYTPYVDFPIDDRRKSGFLIPSFGNSTSTGTDIEIPYYLNLAPQRDATIAPRYMQRRGTMLRTEYRYLTSASSGQLELDYLPNDSVYNDDRSLFAWQHRWDISPRLGFSTFGSTVSDPEYFDDFADSLNITSATHLERRADLNYRGNGWSLLARAQDYETIDPSIAGRSRPYKRLPQIQWRSSGGFAGSDLDYRLDAEWVAFDRRDSLTAQRTDVTYGLSWPQRAPGWFFTPKASYRLTHYALNNIEADNAFASGDDSLSRALPTVSLDGGLFFDRFFGEQRLQTLEPRLFYTYTPFRDQDDIPRFDTSRFGFSFDQMFNEQRFSGADRVGDTNQITTALTTRVINLDSGIEEFRASLGQIHFLSDRRVGLGSNQIETESASSYIGEAAWRPWRSVSVRTTAQWDKNWEQIEQGTTQLQYRPDQQRVLNLAHRYRRDNQEQVDFSAAWPLGSRWTAVGRWSYSLRDQEDLEAFAGLEYRSCCWAVRLLGRRILTANTEEPYNEGVFLQLIFSGMGSLGDPLGELISEGVLGYETDY